MYNVFSSSAAVVNLIDFMFSLFLFSLGNKETTKENFRFPRLLNCQRTAAPFPFVSRFDFTIHFHYVAKLGINNRIRIPIPTKRRTILI
jgi:hypothetical protein